MSEKLAFTAYILRSIASRILKSSRFHPYRISLIHALAANNFALKVNFCRWVQQRIRHFFLTFCFRMNQHLLMTDDLIDITVTIKQPKIVTSR